MKIEYVFEVELGGRVYGNRRDGFDVKDFSVKVLGRDVTNELSVKEFSELREVYLSEKIPQMLGEIGA